MNNSEVRAAQINRLKLNRTQRNEKTVQEALTQLTQAAGNSRANLLELSIVAARARATVGEISLALEKIFGRHQARIQAVQGVYKRELGEGNVTEIQEKIRDFQKKHGRRPRLLIAKVGQDGHDRGQKVVATSFADFGFDVDIGPLFQTPEEVAKQAVENDVHAVALSSLAAGHLTLTPLLIDELKRLGRSDIVVILGGVIPPEDHSDLQKMGVDLIFGPGTVLTEAAVRVLDCIGSQT